MKALMKQIAFGLTLGLASSAWAGPMISGGMPPSPNWVTKAQIMSILESVNDKYDVIRKIEWLMNSDYAVTITHFATNKCRIDYYHVPCVHQDGPLPSCDMQARISKTEEINCGY